MRGLYLKTKRFQRNDVGGSISHTIGIINGFHDACIDLLVLTDVQLNQIRSQQIELQVPTHKWLKRIDSFWFFRRFFKQAIKLPSVREGVFDFIYYRCSLFCTAGNRMADALNIPLIMELNSFETENWNESVRPLIRRKFGRVAGTLANVITPLLTLLIRHWQNACITRADLIIVVSNVLKEELIQQGIASKKILVVPNGVDPEMFTYNPEASKLVRAQYGIHHSDIVVGFIGTFGNWHGIPELTQAVEQLRGHDNLSFLFMGEGSERAAMMHKLKDDKNVHFSGLIPFEQVPTHLSACDILIVSNNWNPSSGRTFFGSPTKLFEYMAMGRAIVGSELGQVSDILRNGENAITFTPGDVAGLIEAIKIAITDPDLRARIGTNARSDVINKYTWKSNANRIVEEIDRRFKIHETSIC